MCSSDLGASPANLNLGKIVSSPSPANSVTFLPHALSRTMAPDGKPKSRIHRQLAPTVGQKVRGAAIRAGSFIIIISGLDLAD